MGSIYKARHRLLDELRVIKVMRPSLEANEELQTRFLHEAKAAARLRHPNIVQVYDFAIEEGLAYIVMELIEGVSLRDLLETDGPPEIERTLEMARQSLEALAYLHRRKFVHRDISPDNLMLVTAAEGEVLIKLIDLGLAKRLEKWTELTQHGAFLGKLRYAPPEQFGGSSLDARSDIYSFGIVLYQLLTGRCPILGHDQGALIAGHLFHPPLDFGESDPEGRVPVQLRAAVFKALAKEPKKRFQTAEEFSGELKAIHEQCQETVGSEKSGFVGIASNVSSSFQEDDTSATRVLPRLRLRTWSLPELPGQPYPVLLPYTHLDLMAGREEEIHKLLIQLQMPVPILGLGAPSGTGKSSFLVGGLVPILRTKGYSAQNPSGALPVALVRHPQEPGVAARLLGEMLDGIEDPIADEDWRGFVEQLGVIESLAGRAPILVLDQFEDVLKEGVSAARARLGLLLAATAVRRPGIDTPPCRWLLAYRSEVHGEILVWLKDVLIDARAVTGSSSSWGGENSQDEIVALPHDLSGPERFQSLILKPFATPSPAGDPLAEVTQIFRAAIEKPLAVLTSNGDTRYKWRFAPGHAERLAKAFAEARLAQPKAPLVPELQVVLAHLLARGSTRGDGEGPSSDGILYVPDDLEGLVEAALDQHLRRALEAAFPDGSPHSRMRRARALLALRELASAAGQRRQGIAAEELAKAIGENGEEILEQLATPLTRLVILQDAPDGLRCVLSHDRLAEVVVRMTEEEGRRGGLLVDTELLRLRRFVALKTALYYSRLSRSPGAGSDLYAKESSRASVATRISRRQFRAIASHAEALLWGSEGRRWWAACQERRRADLRQGTALTASALLFLILVTWGTWSWIRQQSQHKALLDQVAEGEPGPALQALDRLIIKGTSAQELLGLLRRREVAMDVLERGLGATPEVGNRSSGGHVTGDQSALILRTVEIVLPWLDEKPEDPVLIGNLVWALDFGPGRDSTYAAQAHALRERLLKPLREIRSPPSLPEGEDPGWVEVKAGTFWMGSPDGEGFDDEHPQHEVTVSAFRIQRHEVTNADYRRLVPDHPGDSDLPAAYVSWYAATTYAAWLGGRLPTEAEWELAARADCLHAYCTRDGQEALANYVAWNLDNSEGSENGHPVPAPVMQLEPNPWGIYDMLGNLWEWTSDFYAPYPAESREDPWGPAASSGGRRVVRGGSVRDVADRSRAASRSLSAPADVFEYQGFRVVLPTTVSPD